MQLSYFRLSTAQEITTGATSATLTNPFGAQVYAVRLSATAACRYRVVEGTGGTAVATDAFLPANVIEYITVSPGQKIAAIQEAAAGKLSVVELTG